MRLKELFKNYLENCWRRWSRSSCLNKKTCILAFQEFLERAEIKEPEEIQTRHVLEFQKARSEYRNRYGKQDQAQVQNRYLGEVKGFFKYLKQSGELIRDPSEEVDYIKIPLRLPKDALSLREMKRFLKVADGNTERGYRDRTILELFYSTGLRRQELLSLKVQDLDLEEGLLRVIGKGDKERAVPIGRVAGEYLKNYLHHIRPKLSGGRENDTLFLSLNGKPFGRGGLEKLINHCHKKSGIEKKITTHTFRRSCATGMIRNHANVMHVRSLLGHSSMDAIQSYVDLTIMDLKKEHRKTHPREISQDKTV